MLHSLEVLTLLGTGALGGQVLRQVYSRIIYGRWMGHPVEEELRVQLRLGEVTKTLNEELANKVATQDLQMQKVFESLMAKTRG